MFGDGRDMARRPAGGDDERIGQRRAAFQIDRHDVFGLVLIQRFDDAFQDIGCFRRRFGRGVAWI